MVQLAAIGHLEYSLEISPSSLLPLNLLAISCLSHRDWILAVSLPGPPSPDLLVISLSGLPPLDIEYFWWLSISLPLHPILFCYWISTLSSVNALLNLTSDKLSQYFLQSLGILLHCLAGQAIDDTPFRIESPTLILLSSMFKDYIRPACLDNAG